MNVTALLLNYNHNVSGGFVWQKEKATQNLFYIASQRKNYALWNFKNINLRKKKKNHISWVNLHHNKTPMAY